MCAPAHVCLASPGPVGTAAGSYNEPETELPANRSRRAAVSSRGRSLPGWGGDTTDAEFGCDRRNWINAKGASGERELGTVFPQSWRMHETHLKSCARGLGGGE